jgi:16S rRNA (adenine1518-N6/adenine1519-N6)-dimethyltransferase
MHAVQLQAILQGLHLGPVAPRHPAPSMGSNRPYFNRPCRVTALRDRSFSSSSSSSLRGDITKTGSVEQRQPQEETAPPAPAVPQSGWLWDRKTKGKPLNRQSLREQNIKPKKSLGQNFMMDDTVLEAITTAAALSPGDPVLEVGPGTGALTRHLLDTGAALTAVEKDLNLHAMLEIEFEETSTCQLICGDVLRINLPELLTTMVAQRRPDSKAQKVQVVANLPYYITKDFLVQALPEGGCVSRLLLMLQDEVAIRLSQTQPGGPDWRAMNIVVHYYSNPKYLFKIDRKKYIPAPKVHGAVVEFRLKSAAERVSVPDERAFLSLVKKSFLQRRKALRNALQPLVSSAEAVAALESIGLTADARAQELGLEEFVKLAWELEKVKLKREQPASDSDKED